MNEIEDIKNHLFLNKIMHCLNIHDLEGLISIGCPIDEYSPEAKEIVQLLLNNDFDVMSLRTELIKIWSISFGKFCTHYDFEPLIKDLIKIKKDTDGIEIIYNKPPGPPSLYVKEEIDENNHKIITISTEPFDIKNCKNDFEDINLTSIDEPGKN